MLVLHGFWMLDHRLALWAEDSDQPVTSTSQAVRRARPHPFAAPTAVLARHIAGSAVAGPVILELPSVAKSPLDSPEMVRVTPRQAHRSDPALLSWAVPTVELTAAQALTWFSGLRDMTVLEPGTSGVSEDPEDPTGPLEDVRIGVSLPFLADIAAFASDLAEAGSFLPEIAPGKDVVEDAARSSEPHNATALAEARWRPVLRGQDLLAVQEFSRSLPPVCRCAVGSQDPTALVTDMISALVDARVRARAQHSELRLAPPRRGRPPRRLPATEAWLGALTSADGLFHVDPDELAALEQMLTPWDEVGRGAQGPAHATFRVGEAPVDQDGASRWHVEFLLQSTADLSLLVPADRVWDDDGTLARWLDHPQEILLAELGRAARLWPDLSDGLHDARPTGVALDAAGVVAFLTGTAPRLDEAGFGVLVPTWWNRRAKLGLALKGSTPQDAPANGGGAFGRDQLCRFQWRLAVGEDILTEEELQALAEAKAPLVQIRGQWVAFDPDRLRRGMDFLARSADAEGDATVAELLGKAAGADDLPLEVTAVEAEGWVADLLSGAAPRTLQPVQPPERFATALRPYQQRGLSWLSFLAGLGMGACLADDMGLGKTVQLLALEARERTNDSALRPTLLMCPMSLVGNWQREAARFAPDLRVRAHHGVDRAHGEDLARELRDTDLLVTTYGTALRDIDELAAIPWHRLVLDEAQTIKNSRSRAARAVRRLAADHRVALTGTPVENRLSELWSLMDVLNPGLLGSQERFRARFAMPIEREGDADAARRLRAVTRPFLLRRLKTDPTIIDDLPDKIETTEYCRLTVEQASLYRAVVDDMIGRIENSDGIERRGNVLAAMAKLKQVCNHPAQLLHDRSSLGRRSGKVIRLEEILEEILAEGGRVLCFTQFTEFAEMLLPHLCARFATDVAYLHGGTSKKRRDEMVARFQSGDGPRIFLLSLKAGGTGLNLTAANHVIHLDRWWNPAVEGQATDRAFRIGQTRNVQVHKFVCTGTLEERIDDLLTEKKALADLVVTDGEAWLTEMSTEDLRSLMALSEGAVGE